MAAEGWDVVIPATDEKNADDIAAMIAWLTNVELRDGEWVVIIPCMNEAGANEAAGEIRDSHQLAADIVEARYGDG